MVYAKAATANADGEVPPVQKIWQSTFDQDILYHFIQFGHHASQCPKCTKFFVLVTGHLGHVRKSQKCHKISEKWFKEIKILHMVDLKWICAAAAAAI